MHSDFTVNARRPCPFPESHHKDIPRPLPQHYRELASAMAPTMTRPGQMQSIPFRNPLLLACAGARMASALNLSGIAAHHGIREFARRSGMTSPELIVALRSCGAAWHPFSDQKWPRPLPHSWPDMVSLEHIPAVSGQDFHDMTFKYSDMRNISLARANLEDTFLTDCDLNGSCLHRANLARAAMNDLSAVAADLSQAHMPQAYLSHANLRGANLQGADLTGAYLIKTDLTDADLRGAKLDGAELTAAITDGTLLHSKQLTHQQRDELTRQPKKSRIRGHQNHHRPSLVPATPSVTLPRPDELLLA